MSPLPRVAERAETLGGIGRALVRRLPPMGRNFTDLGLRDQLVYVEGLLRGGDKLGAMAVVVLCCDVMVQMPFGDTEVHWMVNELFPSLADNRSIDLSRERETRPFPLKKVTAAAVKVNVSFSDAYESLLAEAPELARRMSQVSGHMAGLYNDQAAMVVLAAAAMSGKCPNAVDVAIQMAQRPEDAKILTIMVKGMGLNSLLSGAVVCEGQCLGGKGLGRGSLFDEAAARVNNKPKDLFSDADLRKAVRLVLDKELPNQELLFSDPDDFWSKRWLWCVNGGHARAAERHDPVWTVETKGRVHRRVAMENWTENPLYKWDGEVFVSASWKEENGKVRLILACDTVSYTCFEHMLRPVEAAWRNNTVLLDPGAGGSAGICDKVRALGNWEHISVMMDYDDFNSQHTTKSMQILFEELAAKTGYDKVLAARLVKSFERHNISAEGVSVGVSAGTLMSGHRGTTIINSVLNLAYVIAADFDMWFDRRYASIHTGDDIVSVFNDYGDVSRLLSRLKDAGVRLNPLKQSVGFYTREFLRMAIVDTYAIGYVLRSVSAVVSGNWVTDGQVGAEGTLTSVVASARSLTNRCGSDLPARLLVKSLVHRTGYRRQLIRAAVLGRVSLNNGPVFDWIGTGGIQVVKVTYPSVSSVKDEYMDIDGSSHATLSYLTNHVSDVERFALEMAKTSAYSSMLEASYAKSLTEREGDVVLVKGKLENAQYVRIFGMDLEAEIRGREPRVGVLSKYPVLQLIKNRLRRKDLIAILARLGHRADPGNVDFVAWGSVGRPILVRGALPYGEAARLSMRTDNGVVTVIKGVYM